MEIKDIINAIRNHRVKITEHADEEAANDGLEYEEVCISVIRGEIIEDYPNDTPFSSCLIYGKNEIGDPIHSVWGYNPMNRWAVLISVYRPDPQRWIDWKTRVKR